MPHSNSLECDQWSQNGRKRAVKRAVGQTWKGHQRLSAYASMQLCTRFLNWLIFIVDHCPQWSIHGWLLCLILRLQISISCLDTVLVSFKQLGCQKIDYWPPISQWIVHLNIPLQIKSANISVSSHSKLH